MYSKIWLAGLGAYGRSEKLGKESIRLFDELAGEGVDVRERAAQKVTSLRHRVKDGLQKNVNKVKGLLYVRANNADIDALSRQVEELSVAVNALAKQSSQTAKSLTATTAHNRRGKV
ncbi:phasin family protein [Candidatus Sororendozoicomonas aggregata]|uniref:phasin family protein n=1 Tax=Candidatus Sororendozoicomonas aggregata TaxID=3073239 RepID=UPI002ED4B66B